MIEQNKVNKENKCYKSPVEELRQPQLLLIQLNKELCFKLSREERNTKSPASNKPGLAYLTKNVQKKGVERIHLPKEHADKQIGKT